jgi:hypothetical protein
LVGPEENRGSAGRTAGLAGVVINFSPILTDERPPLGADGPLTLVRLFGRDCNADQGTRLQLPRGASLEDAYFASGATMRGGNGGALASGGAG